MSEVPDPDPPLDGNRSRGGKLDVKLITTAIRSVRFWGYAAMLLTWALIGDRLVQWTERCPCHEDIIQSMLDPNDKYNWYKINKIWNTFLTEPTMFHHCPCNGLRAPEMVEMKMLI